MHRIRLGGTSRSPGAVQTEGANKRAFWSSSRRLLAVVVSCLITTSTAANAVRLRCNCASVGTIVQLQQL